MLISAPEFLSAGFVIAWMIVVYAVVLLFAYGVWQDARLRASRGKRIRFTSPHVWGLGAVVGGFAVVALYWVIHHSSLGTSDMQPPEHA